MTNRYETHAAMSGPWSVEPVHDALVAARMDELRAGMAKGRDGERIAEIDTTGELSGAQGAVGVRRGAIRAVRLRLGRALVAFGGFIEGPCDCPDGAGMGVGAG